MSMTGFSILHLYWEQDERKNVNTFPNNMFSGAVVGLYRTMYQVSEDVGTVEVCAVVYSPNIDCPIAFPFSVSLSTRNGSASNVIEFSV